jgi:hypothetical protein
MGIDEADRGEQMDASEQGAIVEESLSNFSLKKFERR